MTVISNNVAMPEWSVFPHQTQDGRPIIVRSRLGEPSVRRFAEDNFMVRARCALPRDQVNENGMPVSTGSMDEWEDKCVAELEGMGSQTHLIAVVTGAGVRDLFFAAIEGDELLTAISNVEGDFTFELQLARIDGPREGLLNSLTPALEQ
jgi:hypothetical protein